MTDFSRIAGNYEKSSVVQRSASDQLFDLLQIRPHEDVLDLGCGTGHLTKRISACTRGRVVGLDAAEGMIEECRRNYADLGIRFEVCPSTRIPYDGAFDVIFCNSAFQWFKDPLPALHSCRAALRSGGRMGIQAPARRNYSPNFIAAVQKVARHPRLRNRFASFQVPWFFLDTAEEYRDLFRKAGFEVLQARIEEVVSFHSPEEVFRIFDSGASAGYLNPRYYQHPLTADYTAAFREVVRQSFREQADTQGQVALTFYRIYLLAAKP